jgi:type II secretory pathway component PulK
MAGSGHGERGQASVELVAVLPVVLLLGGIAWQLALAGHAAWMAASAARAGARAEVVGRDPEAAARSVLPRSLEKELRVRRRTPSGVEVSIGVPLILEASRQPVRVEAVSSLGPGP